MAKKRLDLVILERLPHYSRRQIQSWIMQGKITLEGRPLIKAGMQIAPDSDLVVDIHEPKYVSRAGYKLEKALDHFTIPVTGLTVLDAGLSTGGFTDCLLQRGAAKVFGVDVGYGQVHEKIKHDKRVIVLERTNIRNVQDLGQQVDFITLDLSFISVLKVMDAVATVLHRGGQLIILIKPQFEASRRDIRRGGIVKDPAVHQAVIAQILEGVQGYGFMFHGVIESPIEGATGNKEFLAYFKKNV